MKPPITFSFTSQIILLFILVQCLNGAFWWFRGTAAHPERRSGYIKLVAAWMVLGNIPWLILSAGVLSGRIASLDEVFKPSQGNPFVIAFFISVIVLVLLVDLWIFVGNGAQMILDHPSLSRDGTSYNNTTTIKLYALFMTISTFVSTIVTWFSK